MSCGSGQFATWATLSRLGLIPFSPISAPANNTSVKNSLVLDGGNDRPWSWHLVKRFQRWFSFVSKLSPSGHMSSIQLTSFLPIISSSAMATILQNVARAPVSAKGILR